jgi:glycosyltransferase involved in cell wall biosynthesis
MFEIDVVIPVYNGARYLEAAVRSVLCQTEPPARTIIADDGSQDETPAIARRLAKECASITYLPLLHRGVSAARNAGIRASTAPLIAFLDADDLWLPSKLASQLRVLKACNDDVGLVHTSYSYIDGDGNSVDTMPVFQPTRRGDIFLPLLLEGYVVSGSASSVLVKRSVLDQAGYFDERLFHGEDWDMWLRLAAICKVDFSPEPLVVIRIHRHSAQRREPGKKSLSFFKQHLLIFSKWPQHIAARRDFTTLLRKQAALMLLATMLRPSRIEEFYRALASSEDALARSLFKNRFDLWSLLAAYVGRYLVWRVRKLFFKHPGQVA